MRLASVAVASHTSYSTHTRQAGRRLHPATPAKSAADRPVRRASRDSVHVTASLGPRSRSLPLPATTQEVNWREGKFLWSQHPRSDITGGDPIAPNVCRLKTRTVRSTHSQGCGTSAHFLRGEYTVPFSSLRMRTRLPRLKPVHPRSRYQHVILMTRGNIPLPRKTKRGPCLYKLNASPENSLSLITTQRSVPLHTNALLIHHNTSMRRSRDFHGLGAHPARFGSTVSRLAGRYRLLVRRHADDWSVKEVVRQREPRVAASHSLDRDIDGVVAEIKGLNLRRVR